MTNETFTAFDAAAYLRTDAEIADFLTEAASNGAEAFSRALGVAARARKLNMTAAAQRANVTRQGLHKALGDKGKPSLALALDVLTSLDMTITVRPQSECVTLKKQRQQFTDELAEILLANYNEKNATSLYAEALSAVKAARDKIAHGGTTGRIIKTPRRSRETSHKAR